MNIDIKAIIMALVNFVEGILGQFTDGDVTGAFGYVKKLIEDVMDNFETK